LAVPAGAAEQVPAAATQGPLCDDDDALLAHLRSALGAPDAAYDEPVGAMQHYGQQQHQQHQRPGSAEDDVGTSFDLFFRQPASIGIEAPPPRAALGTPMRREGAREGQGAADQQRAAAGGPSADWEASPMREPATPPRASAAAQLPVVAPHSSGVKGRATRVPVAPPTEDDAAGSSDKGASGSGLGGGGGGVVKGTGGGSRHGARRPSWSLGPERVEK
jgi:hypothetical protein